MSLDDKMLKAAEKKLSTGSEVTINDRTFRRLTKRIGDVPVYKLDSGAAAGHLEEKIWVLVERYNGKHEDEVVQEWCICWSDLPTALAKPAPEKPTVEEVAEKTDAKMRRVRKKPETSP